MDLQIKSYSGEIWGIDGKILAGYASVDFKTSIRLHFYIK